MSQQLVKKGTNGKHENVMPKSWIEAIKDKNTGQTLVEILQGFNMYFLSYNGNTSATRCLVSTMLRKKGLWITYVKYDGNVYTEWYAADEIDDKSWGDSSNWRIGNNSLVGDITISANGNWVINGTETEFKAVGEKGNTPLLRVANNRLQVSYDLGDTYRDVTDNPVYTKFRWLATSGDTQANNVGRIQASTDEGKTWTNMSNDFTNNLHISRYIGTNESLPTSGIAEGTIYAKGPYYAEEDTLNDNPIYRLWVYAWKGNTLAWQDNGEFTSIAAGIVQEMGDSETEVMSQKAVTNDIGSKINNRYVKDNVDTHTVLNVPVFLKKGTYIKNNGIPIIVADNSSLEGRVDLTEGTIRLLESDKLYIQTSGKAGTVDFELINYLDYNTYLEKRPYLTERYTNNFTSYTTINFRKLPKGTIFVNHGVPLIVADDNSLVGRIDIASNKTIILDSDKLHIRVASVGGIVDFEVCYIPEKSISGNKIQDSTITEDKTSFIIPINIASEIKIGKYYSGAGYNDNPSYDVTGKIPIKEGVTYCWNNNARFVHIQSINQVTIKTIEENIESGSSYTAEEGDAYMIITFYATDLKQYQVEVGNVPSAYSSPDNRYIKKELIPSTNDSDKNVTFKGWRNNAELKNGDILTLPNINICKNIIMSALIKGNIENVSVGVSWNGYYGKNITLTPTELIIKGGTNNSIISTIKHGLSINDFAILEISKGDTSEAIIRLSNDKGERREDAITWGTSMGKPFVKNDSSSAVNVTFNFMPRDISKDIWMFGDSYFGMYDPSRWLYYIIKSEYTNILVDAKGGESAPEGLSDFENLLSLGATPKYVVWCHGMNGGADQTDAVNSVWLNSTKKVLLLCERYNITPVLATIPSVPSQVHVKLNEWVRNSGHRYIDFASAVETDDNYYWKGWSTMDALLSSDEIHPSNKGAVVLAAQSIIDFPEIAIDK